MNVLFICADQWRGDSLSILGHPVVRTPNIDALAKDGVLFKNHFTQCTPCGPSRTSLLTGLYLMNHRSVRNGTPLDGRHTNIALEMRKGGYDPVLFGYTDTSVSPAGRHPNDPALRYYDEGVMPGFTPLLHMPEHMTPWVGALKARGYDLPNGRTDIFKPRAGFEKPADRGFRYIPAIYDAADSDTAFVTDRFLEWLSIQKKNWFAHVVYMRPHPPIIAPEPYNALYDPASVPLPVRAVSAEEEADAHPFIAYAMNKMDRVGDYDEANPLNFLRMEELELRQMRATFYGLMTEVDHHIGRIVEYLKSSGEYDRTLIIFTSDHGEMLGDHHVWGKEVFFDQAMHVPLVIRDPSSPGQAGIVDAFTQAIDVMPTILERLGLSTPVTCDGRSLADFLSSSDGAKWREEAFWEHDFRDVVNLEPESFLGLPSDACNYAVLRDRKFKYIHFAGLRPLLYDVQNDPGETANLASRPEYAGVMLEYAQRMLNWRLTSVDRAMTHSMLTSKGLFTAQ
jgi:arylsulfatase A-like enzyme